MPRFFVMPRDYEEFRADLERNPDRLYIQKVRGCQCNVPEFVIVACPGCRVQGWCIHVRGGYEPLYVPAHSLQMSICADAQH